MADKDIQTSPATLRRLGDSEKFSSTRHHLGIYRCVTVTCRYQPPPSGGSSPIDKNLLNDNSISNNASSISPTFYAALAAVVKTQPMLHVGILDQHTNTARFTHVPQVDLRQHVSVDVLACDTLAEYEAQVAERQGWHHDQLWEQLETRPPWRINILRPGGEALTVLKQQQQQPYEDILFAYHHSLMDGTSGRQFHEMLLAALIEQQSSKPTPIDEEASNPILCFPTAPTLPESQEDAIGFKNSTPYIIRTLWTAFAPSLLKSKKPPLWYGKKIDYAIPHKTRVKPVDITPDILSSLLAGCKSQSTSLTGLMHALVLASFALRLSADEAAAFASSTPINIRPFARAHINPSLRGALRGMISSFTHQFSPSVVTAFRQPGADIDGLIWQNAQRVKAELNGKLATMPQDDILGMLKYIGDWFGFWHQKNGKPRSESWEVSNIGVLKNPISPDSDAPSNCTQITRLLFTNGAMVAGPALGVNCGSVARSSLTAALSWQDTVVSDEVVIHLADDLAGFASRFHETGTFKE